ncbi:MAG TPA: MraY family glycosyltransferase [Syntrophorhabdaceae bacterium]|jgi:UDP-GlcNAc:undecaprenyl-phosphate GlcNAc-1-phosphate transferase
MTTVIATFFIALLISLIAAPLAGKLGRLIGAVDKPNERKMHYGTIPRSGGIAIFVAFWLTMLLCGFLKTQVSELFTWNPKMIGFFTGGGLIFAVGLLDDIYRLGAKVKLLLQIAAATVAFGSGMQVDTYYFLGGTIHSFIISYCLTIFWFVLLINAINLTDGLDGLAGGITFFVCIIITVLLVWRGLYLSALLFAALGGSVLGFLRYNFNPASIFMGDGGSYFLGYAIAGLAILSSAKAQTATIVLIPLIAMGVPVFDTILSPVRRFMIGKKLFQPDKSHIHHKLVEMGFSKTKAVLLIYAISVALCLFAVVMVNIQDKRAGLFIIIVGVAALLFTRKLGYFEYLASDKVFGWFRDITDVAGISHNRRSFLGLQIEISQSQDLEELWENVGKALEFLRFDRADLYVGAEYGVTGETRSSYVGHERRHDNAKLSEPVSGFPLSWEAAGPRRESWSLHWVRGYYRRRQDVDKGYMLTVKVPLVDSEFMPATLHLIKDTKKEQLDNFTLRRAEQLRETMIKALDWIEREKKEHLQPVHQKGVRYRKAHHGAMSAKKAILEKRSGI